MAKVVRVLLFPLKIVGLALVVIIAIPVFIFKPNLFNIPLFQKKGDKDCGC